MFNSQLTLSLGGTAAASSFESFFAGVANANAAASVKAFCDGELHEQQLLLWGAANVGKTHLLSAACQDFANRGYRAAYLTGELANNEDALDGIEMGELVCFDNLEDLAPESEERLFHAVNRCRESGARLLFAMQPSIDALAFSLPDLKTRLSWGAVFQLQFLEDEELPTALRKLLGLRGFDVSEDVIDYILRRYPRNMAALTDLVNQLDQLSMTEKRRITIPLVRSVNEGSA